MKKVLISFLIFLVLVTTVSAATPKVSLISPPQSYWTTPGNINFIYRVQTQNPLYSCSLYINNKLIATDTSVKRNTIEYFAINLGVGTYDWYVTCITKFNTIKSVTHRFYII